ncbi:ArsR/SmtB family transcription factor [Acidianus ambivalens]|uniref:ArsR family transcriptional regulator n=1 Tax=Acidianus ambivalens TaxID=2283 RepID=A0A650CV55_ACIAM|nr:winged helix-turn-helix domain-containing protein [Acidianus ambivalens]MQL55683.1 ArsR family transcriptional regulator [Acidianus ambivalens]QGR21740.1 ArsR family transcriptional regulator [Acidianus ambivalens]
MLYKLDEVIENKGWDTRKKILELLQSKEMTAYEISKILELNYSTVKYHLELLERVGLVTVKKDKRNRYLYKANNNIKILNLINK